MAILDFFKKEKLETEDLNELKKEIENLQKTQEKERQELLNAQNELSQQLEQERNKFAENEKKLQEVQTEYTTVKDKMNKELAVVNKLVEDGANPKLINLFKKEVDFERIEFENDQVKNWAEVSSPLKNQYADFFGNVETKGVEPIKPLESNKKEEDEDLIIKGFKRGI